MYVTVCPMDTWATHTNLLFGQDHSRESMLTMKWLESHSTYPKVNPRKLSFARLHSFDKWFDEG